MYYGTAVNSEVIIDDESSAYAWIPLSEIERYPMAESQKKRLNDVLKYCIDGKKRVIKWKSQ